MKINNSGFATIEIALLAFVGCLIIGTGWFVWHARNNANKSLTNASNINYATKLPANKATTKSQEQPPTQQPSSSTPSTSTSKTTAKSTAAATPPAQPIVLTPALSISADGCSVTANGSQGFTLFVSVQNESKGGESTETLPASATLTVSSGGIQGMTVHAILRNSNGTALLEKYGTITATQCW